MNQFFTILNNDTDKKTSMPFFQPKLSINQPGDPDSYRDEQEADDVSDKVMRKGEAARAETFFSSVPVVNSGEGSNQYAAQAKDPHLPSSGGQPLSKEDRNFFETGIGYDFSNVRIHANKQASDSAKNINALAYTYKNNIVFNEGQYQPSTASGRRLLAHELTHVVQQAQGKSMLQRYPKGPGMVPDFMKERVDKALSSMQLSMLDYEVRLANDIITGGIDIAVPDFVDTSLSPPQAMPPDKAFNRKQQWEQGLIPDVGMKAYIPGSSRELPLRKGSEAITLHHHDYDGIIYLLSFQRAKPFASTLLHEAVHLMHPLSIKPNEPGAEKEKFISELRSYYYADYRHINNTGLRFERAIADAEKDTAYLAGEGISLEQAVLDRQKYMAEIGTP